MIITKNRVQNIDKYLKDFNEKESLYVILNDIDRHKNRLILMGFSFALPIGEKVLPSVFGSVSNYNANGKSKKLKDLPKENFYVEQSREIKDWHGNYHSVSTSMRYKRYQTEFIDAPSQELTILENENKEKIISSDMLIVTDENKELIKHTINLFLELFGECNIVDDEFLSRQKTPIKRVSWNILPRGMMPWEKIREPLLELLEKTDIKSKYDTLNRFEFINDFNPDFVATGNGGFNDYVVFGFTDRNLYVLENSFAGNATYIFSNDWETLSQLSKAEILAENLQIHRLIHRKNWKQNIREILR